MIGRATLFLLAPCLVATLGQGCGPTTEPVHTTPPTTDPVAQPDPPPPERAIDALTVLPEQTAAIVTVETERLRSHPHGELLVNLLRPMWLGGWEEATGRDFMVETDRIVSFVVRMEDQPRLPLNALFTSANWGQGGVVLQLADNDEVCWEEDLAQATEEHQLINGTDFTVIECGNLVIWYCCIDASVPFAPTALSPATEAIGQASSSLASPHEVLAIAAGPTLVNAADCPGGSVPLEGWQSMIFELGDAAAAHARFRAGSAGQATELQSCLQQTVDTIANEPALSGLGLDPLFQAISISPDPQEEKDLLVDVSVSGPELDMLSGMLEMLLGN